MGLEKLGRTLLLCAGIALGCGGDDDDGSVAGSGGGGGTGGGNATALCQRWAEIACSGEASCCSNPGRDMTACMTDAVQECSSRLMLDAISEDPAVAFNMSAANTAFSAFESRVQSCDLGIAAWAVSGAGFAGVFSGTLDAGASCVPSSLSNQRAILVALASCKNPSSTACLPTSDTSWTCAARGQAGAPCFTDLNCAEGLYCEPGSETYDGTCAARKADGQACSMVNECMSLICEANMCATATADLAYCPD